MKIATGRRGLRRVFGLNPAEESFVESRDLCRIATCGRDGWPHCVPVGYVYKNGLFYIPSSKSTRKVLNLRADRRSCIMIDDEDSGQGLMLQGRIEIVEDERFRRLARWMKAKTGWTMGKYSKSAFLIFKPLRKASWR